MKTISLTQGKCALVDDEDFAELDKLKWCAVKGNSGIYYAVRGTYLDRIVRHQFMHRVILGVSDSKIQVDHKDHDGLNNQKSNLRKANHSQNARNCSPRQGSSRFLGVGWCKRTGKWQAQIKNNYKAYHLGRFDTEIEAAMARDEAAKKYHGEFAHLNLK